MPFTAWLDGVSPGRELRMAMAGLGGAGGFRGCMMSVVIRCWRRGGAKRGGHGEKPKRRMARNGENVFLEVFFLQVLIE